jgi:hypothetical protein
MERAAWSVAHGYATLWSRGGLPVRGADAAESFRSIALATF